MSIDQVLEWFQSNWGETGLISAFAALIVRLLWNHAKAWCRPIQKWFRAPGSTRTLGITKHRDKDDDVVLSLRAFGRDFEIHSSGKYVDTPTPNITETDSEDEDADDQ